MWLRDQTVPVTGCCTPTVTHAATAALDVSKLRKCGLKPPRLLNHCGVTTRWVVLAQVRVDSELVASDLTIALLRKTPLISALSYVCSEPVSGKRTLVFEYIRMALKRRSLPYTRRDSILQRLQRSLPLASLTHKTSHVFLFVRIEPGQHPA